MIFVAIFPIFGETLTAERKNIVSHNSCFNLFSLKQINFECTSDFKNVCYPFFVAVVLSKLNIGHFSGYLKGPDFFAPKCPSLH
jgi:hypothetical protein